MATHSSILAWKNLMDRGAWWTTVHGVSKSWIRLSSGAGFPSLVAQLVKNLPAMRETPV